MPLSQDALLAMVSKSSSLSAHKLLSLCTILKHPLIQFLNETASSESKNEMNDNWVLKLLRQHGDPNFIMTVDTLTIYLSAIAENIGIGFMTKSNVGRLPKSYLDRISIIPIRPALNLDNLYVFRTDTPSKALIDTCIPFFHTSAGSRS